MQPQTRTTAGVRQPNVVPLDEVHRLLQLALIVLFGILDAVAHRLGRRLFHNPVVFFFLPDVAFPRLRAFSVLLARIEGAEPLDNPLVIAQRHGLAAVALHHPHVDLAAQVVVAVSRGRDAVLYALLDDVAFLAAVPAYVEVFVEVPNLALEFF